MWGTSFNDLAKKAAEMQEQATASMTSPVAPSFSMGGMFNMDALQQTDGPSSVKKGDAFSPLQLQQQQQQKPKPFQQQQQQQQQQRPASKLQPPQSYMSDLNANMLSMVSITPNSSSNNNNKFGTAKATPGGNTIQPPAKKLFPSPPPTSATKKSPLVTPRSKLVLPVKPKTINANNNTANTIHKSAISGGGNKLTINKPASSLITKPQSSANVNNSSSSNNNGGLVVGANKSQFSKPKPGTATAPELTTTAKQKTQATGLTTPTIPAAATRTTAIARSKLVTPKPVPKQQHFSDLSKAATHLSKPITQQQQQHLSSPASVPTMKSSQSAVLAPKLATSTGIPQAKPDQQQQEQQQQSDIEHQMQQQSTTPQASTTAPTIQSARLTSRAIDTTIPPKGPEETSKLHLPASSLPTTLSSSSTTNKTTTASNNSIAETSVTTGKESGSNNKSMPDAAATKEEQSTAQDNEEAPAGAAPASTSLPLEQAPGNLREQLQQQEEQEEFRKKLEEQRQQMEGTMQKLQQQFSEQLQRLEVHHREEIEATIVQQEASLAHWQQQVRDREMLLESQSQKAEFEQQNSLSSIDQLTSQLNQARELLADKEVEDRRLQEAHLNQLREMEKQCFKKEDATDSLGKDIQTLQNKLEESKTETKNALEDFGKLKERAKTVAGELKEKRAECRTLSSEIDLLKDAKDSLQDRITHLEATGMDMNTSSEESQAKIDSLQDSLDETKKQLKDAKEEHEKEIQKAGESLSNYKKKAQHSLALANARSASAVQSREEAEMEARAARSTADTAMERAMESELNGRQALAEAKVYMASMKGEVSKYESVKAQLEDTSKELKQIQIEAKTHKDSNEKLRCELTSLSGRLEAEQAMMEDLKAKIDVAENRSNELYDEAERLRKESQKYQYEIKRLVEANKTAADSSSTSEEAAAIVRVANAEAEATIAMLQQELQDANLAIKDLKATLLDAIEEKDSLGDVSNGNGTMNGNHHQSENNNTPLFYAMEKQAELAQARDEIARMANLLGDAESSKQEALDEMYGMKRSMEDAQSKLQRQEQLQTKNNSNGGDNEKNNNLNLEYLKNIVLSYLNAESIQEKKALLPVIGTVLCLTQAEQNRAIEQLDKGNGSVMDTVATSVLGSYWS